MLRLAMTCSVAAAVLAVSAAGIRPSLAQQALSGLWGSGPNRVCSVLVDKTDKPVINHAADDAIHTLRTFDCPETVPVGLAQVAPAAPPPAALPGQGVIYFDFDKANLNPKAESTLNQIIADIKGRELGGITVGGHTDTAGPPAYNMQLSQRRANTVAAELVRSGIPAQIVTTKAYGETNLAVQTPDNTPDQANRRATIDFQR
jgi:outer membrane protein OmpA-like peptidoglycan-associated protein